MGVWFFFQFQLFQLFFGGMQNPITPIYTI